MMATPRTYLEVVLIQLRRKIARRRMARDLNWRTGWSK